MNKSNEIGKLAAALAKAQGELKPAEMNSQNPFLKNKFADLGSVIEAVRPTLAKYELSFAQFPVNDTERIGLETILMHSSGEWLSDAVFLPMGEEKGKSLAQVAGSVITYLRRYSLSSVLGVYADEDNDGTQAQRAPQQQPVRNNPAPAQAASKPVVNPTPPKFDGVPVKASRDTFFELANKHGLQKEAAAIATAHAKTQDWDKAYAELSEQVKAFA